MAKDRNEYIIYSGEYMKLLSVKSILTLVNDNFKNTSKINKKSTNLYEVFYNLKIDGWRPNFYLAKVLNCICNYQYFYNDIDNENSMYGLKHLLYCYFLTVITFNIQEHKMNVKNTKVNSEMIHELLLSVEILQEAMELVDLWDDRRNRDRFKKSPSVEKFLRHVNIDSYLDICSWITQRITTVYKLDLDYVLKRYIKSLNESVENNEVCLDNLLHSPDEVITFDNRSITVDGFIIKK